MVDTLLSGHSWLLYVLSSVFDPSQKKYFQEFFFLVIVYKADVKGSFCNLRNVHVVSICKKPLSAYGGHIWNDLFYIENKRSFCIVYKYCHLHIVIQIVN